MTRWTFGIQLDHQAGRPLFRQIASAIVEDIRRGRLRPGDRLPGSRTLARTIGVNRQTVVATLDELTAEGWLQTAPARGTFVSTTLPTPAHRSRVPERGGILPRTPFPVPDAPPGAIPYDVPPGGLLLAPNRPDTRLIPYAAIGRAYGRAIRRSGHILLGYGRPQGHEPLRMAVATMLSATRGLVASADDVCITRGSQMGIALLARTLVRPGDVVAVEELCHQPAVRRRFACRVRRSRRFRWNESGSAQHRRARAPRAHAEHPCPVPDAATSSPRPSRCRRRAVCSCWSSRARTASRSSRRTTTTSSTMTGVRCCHWQASTATAWSPTSAPSRKCSRRPPRVGYIVAPRALVTAAAAHRLHLDVQGDRVLEHALADLIEVGEVQRHVRLVHREYAARRDVLVRALRRSLDGALTFTVPGGGIALWAAAAPDLDIDVWAERAKARGVVMVTARSYAVDRKPRPYARLGFASLDRKELVEAVRRLTAARPPARRTRA